MAAWLIGLTGFIYLATAVSLYMADKTGLSIAFGGYALANIGLYMEAV